MEAALRKCIAESDPAFENDVVRKVVLSFCVQGCYYTFTSYCGQMDETRLVALLASIARAAQRSGCEYNKKAMAAAMLVAVKKTDHTPEAP